MTVDLLGKLSSADYFDPQTYTVFVRAGQPLNQAALEHLKRVNLLETELQLHKPALTPMASPRPLVPIPVAEPKTRAPIPHHSQTFTSSYDNPPSAAFIALGTPSLMVNGRTIDDYFESAPDVAHQTLNQFLGIPEIKATLSRMNVQVRIFTNRDSLAQHAKAVVHCIAWALISHDPDRFKSLFRKHNLAGLKSSHRARR